MQTHLNMYWGGLFTFWVCIHLQSCCQAKVAETKRWRKKPGRRVPRSSCPSLYPGPLYGGRQAPSRNRLHPPPPPPQCLATFYYNLGWKHTKQAFHRPVPRCFVKGPNNMRRWKMLSETKNKSERKVFGQSEFCTRLDVPEQRRPPAQWRSH